jgi:NADH-quinone oxidoreductase subunit J
MLIFALAALLTLAGAICAMCLRNLVHCALSLAAAFGGLAAIYLQLEAQFVGFAQVLVYVGAVSILILFAILLTRGSEPPRQALFSSGWWAGAAVAAAVFALLAAVVVTSRHVEGKVPPVPSATVRQIGDQLMTRYVLPLEVVGLLLTAALIGAVIMAMKERQGE